MKWWLLIISCCLCSCTVTITAFPNKHRRYYYHHSASPHRTTLKAKTQLVDSEWVSRYKDMEEDRGDFTISQDEQIQQSGDKFRVPQAVLDHYQDMLKAKASPSP